MRHRPNLVRAHVRSSVTSPANTPDASNLQAVMVAWLGSFVVISATWAIFASEHLVYAFASLGGSAVIVFGMPDSVMAQPRSLFGGHAIGAVSGLAFLWLFGQGPWAIAAAVATALAAMQITRTIHSPAGADPIIVMSGAISLPEVVLDLAAGLILLWLTGIILLNAFRVRPYGRNLPVIGPIATFIAMRWGSRLQSAAPIEASSEPNGRPPEDSAK